MDKLLTILKPMGQMVASAIILSACAKTNLPTNQVAITPINQNNLITQKTDQSPSWLQNHVALQSKHMPLKQLVKTLLRDQPITLQFSPECCSSPPVNIHIDDTIAQALTKVAAMTNTHFILSNNTLLWDKTATQVFSLAFLPQQLSKTNQDQLWANTTATMKTLASPQGKVIADQATTSMSVIDTPNNIQRMHDYLSQLQQTLTKMIHIKVTLLTVTPKHHAINWRNISQQLNNRTPSTHTNLLLSTPLSQRAIIHALEKQAYIKINTSTQLVTTHNEPATLKLIDQSLHQKMANEGQHYLPGTETKGLMLSLLPRIQDHTIYLNINSMTLSSLQMVKVSSASGSSLRTQRSPNLLNKYLQQKIKVRSGSTLVIAGFTPLHKSAKSSSSKRYVPKQTLVLITPTTIEKT